MIALHIHIYSPTSLEISRRSATAIAGTDQNILQFYFGQNLKMDPKITQSLTIKGCVRVSVCNVITQLSHWLSELNI